MDVALACLIAARCRTGIHASSTHPKQAASRFPRLPTRSTSPIRLPNLATKILSANLNAFPRQSGVGITGLRKEDRKQKQSEHECRNGFGEGDKIATRLGIEVLPPQLPAICDWAWFTVAPIKYFVNWKMPYINRARIMMVTMAIVSFRCALMLRFVNDNDTEFTIPRCTK